MLPLLSNILLTDLDNELERRGHKFIRYADDCNIYVKSKEAGQRLLDSVTGYLESVLKLTVNRDKSDVGRPWMRVFLGYILCPRKRNVRLRVSGKAINRFKGDLKRIMFISLPELVIETIVPCSVQGDCLHPEFRNFYGNNSLIAGSLSMSYPFYVFFGRKCIMFRVLLIVFYLLFSEAALSLVIRVTPHLEIFVDSNERLMIRGIHTGENMTWYPSLSQAIGPNGVPLQDESGSLVIMFSNTANTGSYTGVKLTHALSFTGQVHTPYMRDVVEFLVNDEYYHDNSYNFAVPPFSFLNYFSPPVLSLMEQIAKGEAPNTPVGWTSGNLQVERVNTAKFDRNLKHPMLAPRVWAAYNPQCLSMEFSNRSEVSELIINVQVTPVIPVTTEESGHNLPQEAGGVVSNNTFPPVLFTYVLMGSKSETQGGR